MAHACSVTKALYFAGGTPIKNLMNHENQDCLEVINTQLKGFAQNTKDCKVVYQVAQKGTHYLTPHMERRKMFTTYDDFGKCIEIGNYWA